MNTVINKAMDFGRVALVVGGDSAEREVSIDGGKSVAAALQRLGVEHQLIDGAAALFAEIGKGSVQTVFNLMHGSGGEDGCLSGALQLLGIPTTGSGVLGSALAMDKVRSKQVWQATAIPTTNFIITAKDQADYDAIMQQFEFPVFVKPVNQGSSLGISKVKQANELKAAIDHAASYSEQVMVEPGIVGREYFAGVVAGECLPLIGVQPANEFYDYAAKYESDETQYFCPSGLHKELEESLQQQAMQAFLAVGASGWGRVDFILDEQQQPWFLEVNTIPGMTDHSLLPQAAAEIGISFDQLVWKILQTSLEAHQ